MRACRHASRPAEEGAVVSARGSRASTAAAWRSTPRVRQLPQAASASVAPPPAPLASTSVSVASAAPRARPPPTVRRTHRSSNHASALQSACSLTSGFSATRTPPPGAVSVHEPSSPLRR
eukprot:scaffold63436_cov39-Phaeocystis_antarctica.AAC.2